LPTSAPNKMILSLSILLWQPYIFFSFSFLVQDEVYPG
uniref:Uncharacterized protein n=1 Tax=Aegilops tauschii subsp. strangulata TaxID=200361 RepID=A0A453DH25_AEGTS